ncbi:MAG: VOC family protein [Pseudomonadota bacterium]
MAQIDVGAVSFFGMAAPYLEKAKPFYAALFGWRIEQSAPARPASIEGAGIPGFGHDTDQIAGFRIYFRTSDIEASAARVRQLGGWAESAPAVIPGMGKLLNCRDDQGLEFGLHQPEP